MTRVYERYLSFTHGADGDLLVIWLETNARWGEAQADRYQDQLHDGCQHIADGIVATYPVEGVANVRFYHCRRHFLFYTVQADEPIIIAVLHDRMDLPRRLVEWMKSAESLG